MRIGDAPGATGALPDVKERHDPAVPARPRRRASWTRECRWCQTPKDSDGPLHSGRPTPSRKSHIPRCSYTSSERQSQAKSNPAATSGIPGSPYAAQDGDEVAVCDGAHSGAGDKNLDFHGKAITVRSATGPENCIIDCIRELSSIRVQGQHREHVRHFINEMQPQVRARLDGVATSAEAIKDADVVCTATNSRTPVFDGSLLEAGTHINGVGSFTLEMQEVDTIAVGRARIFIDCVEAASAEAGDLVIAERAGRTRRRDWTELGLVVAGIAGGRQNAEEITFFKSVGHAVQDVAAASRALEAARSRGLGKELEI